MSVNPIGKIVYLCDDVVQDPHSGKLSFLGIFNDVIPLTGGSYPFRLARICVAAQLVGGSGAVPIQVEIIEAATQNLVHAFGPFTVNFPTRRTIRTVSFRMHDVVFPAPGEYFVEVHSHGVFLDDRLLRLH